MTAYDDLDTPQTMRTDAAAAGAQLPVLQPRLAYQDVYAAYPNDLPKREVEVSEAARRIAAAVFG